MAALLAVCTLGVLILVCLPYGPLKAGLGLLMPDGNFKSLNEANAVVFRVLFALTGLVMAAGAWLCTNSNVSQRAWMYERRQEARQLFLLARSEPDERYFIRGVYALMLIGLIARLAALQFPLNHDEAYTATVFAPSLWGALTDYHAPNNHVFHTILVHFSTRLFGDEPWTLRLPALLAGVLSIPAGYKAGRALYGKYTGLMAAVLICGLPVQIMYSTSARGYSMLQLITLLLAGFAVFVLRQKNVMGWMALVVLGALGFWTVPVMLFPFGTVFIWLLLESLLGGAHGYDSLRDFLKYWLVAVVGVVGLTFILYAPVLVYTELQHILNINNPLLLVEFLPAVKTHILGTYSEWMDGAPAWLGYALLAGFALGLVFHRRISRLKFPMQLAALAWLVLIAFIQRPVPWVRIWYALMGLFIIWCAAGISELAKNVRLPFLKNASLSVGLIVALCILPIVAGWNSLTDMTDGARPYGREETAVLFLKEQIRPGDLFVALDPAVWYYSRLNGISDRQFVEGQLFDRVFVMVAPGTHLADTLLWSRLDSHLLDMESAHLVQGFSGLDIYLIETR